MKKQKGITLIETIFVLALIGLLAYWGTDIFYNQKKKMQYHDNIKTMEKQSFYIKEYFKKAIRNNHGFVYKNNKLTIISPTTHCLNENSSNDIYTFSNNKIYCNGKVFFNNIVDFNLKIGISKGPKSSINNYTNNYDGSQYAKYIFLEFYIKSKKDFFNNKQYHFHTFKGVKDFNSNSILEGFRDGFFIN